MDLMTARILLAREAGYLPTALACQRLKVSATQLLALRRQLLQETLDVAQLPRLAVREPGNTGR